MLGRRVSSAEHVPGRLATLYKPERSSSVRPGSRSAPAFVTGTLTGVDADSLILISLGKKVVATTRAFSFRDQVWFGAVLPPGTMKPGANRVVVYKQGSSGNLVRIWSN